jgi:hypothetical protein
MQRIEIRDAVDAEHHRLAVDREPPMTTLQRDLDDPRMAVRHAVVPFAIRRSGRRRAQRAGNSLADPACEESWFLISECKTRMPFSHTQDRLSERTARS